MVYKPNDFYARKARSESFVARSVYKLQEIDERFNVISKNNHILDLGASPGSWSQYSSNKIGAKGVLIGIDITPIDIVLPNAHFIELDIYSPLLKQKIEETGVSPYFDVVISDMAPNTIGVKNTDQARSYGLCEMALWVAQQYLRPNGNFVCKMFDQAESQDYRKILKQQFAKVDILRPQSTRKSSKEIFFIAMGYTPFSENNLPIN